MYFRLKSFVNGLRMEAIGEAVLEFAVNSPTVTVSLRDPTEIELEQAGNRACTIASAATERQPNGRVLAAFELLSEGRVPDGSVDISITSWSGYLNEDGSLKHNTRLPIPMELLPQNMQSFVTQIRDELYGAIQKVVGAIRWRMAVPGPPDPITSVWRSAEWSLNGETWYMLPASMSITIRGAPLSIVDEDESRSLNELLTTFRAEPTGHILFREAWELRDKHLRSSLLTGIAALEVGFKDFAAEIVPAAEWLLVNAPSPPVVKMLQEYLPKMEVRLRINGNVLPPPKVIADLLVKGVNLRNQVAHSKALTLKPDTLQSILLAVQDVLWLLDYYRGHSWALMHMREVTRTALGVEESQQESV